MSKGKSLKRGFFVSLCVAGVGLMLQGCGGGGGSASGGGGGGASVGGGASGGSIPSSSSQSVSEDRVTSVTSTAATAVEDADTLKEAVKPFTESTVETVTTKAAEATKAAEDAIKAAKAAADAAKKVQDLYDKDPTQVEKIMEAMRKAIGLATKAQVAMIEAITAAFVVAEEAKKDATLVERATKIIKDYDSKSEAAADSAEENLNALLATAKRKKGDAEDARDDAEDARNLAQAADVTAATARDEAGYARGFADDAQTAAGLAKEAYYEALPFKFFNDTTAGIVKAVKEVANDAEQAAQTADDFAGEAETAALTLEDNAKTLQLNKLLKTARKGESDAEAALNAAKAAKKEAGKVGVTTVEALIQAGIASQQAGKAEDAVSAADSASDEADGIDSNSRQAREASAAALRALQHKKLAQVVAKDAKDAAAAAVSVKSKELNGYLTTAQTGESDAKEALRKTRAALQVVLNITTYAAKKLKVALVSDAAGKALSAANSAGDASDEVALKYPDSSNTQAEALTIVAIASAATNAEGFAGEAESVVDEAEGNLSTQKTSELETLLKTAEKGESDALIALNAAKAARGRAGDTTDTTAVGDAEDEQGKAEDAAREAGDAATAANNIDSTTTQAINANIAAEAAERYAREAGEVASAASTAAGAAVAEKRLDELLETARLGKEAAEAAKREAETARWATKDAASLVLAERPTRRAIAAYKSAQTASAAAAAASREAQTLKSFNPQKAAAVKTEADEAQAATEAARIAEINAKYLLGWHFNAECDADGSPYSRGWWGQHYADRAKNSVTDATNYTAAQKIASGAQDVANQVQRAADDAKEWTKRSDLVRMADIIGNKVQGIISQIQGWADEAQAAADSVQRIADNMKLEETLGEHLATAKAEQAKAKTARNQAIAAQRAAEKEGVTVAQVRRQAGNARGFATKAEEAAGAAVEASDEAQKMNSTSQQTQEVLAVAALATQYKEQAQAAATAAEEAVVATVSAKNDELGQLLKTAEQGESDAKGFQGEAEGARDLALNAATPADANPNVLVARSKATLARKAADSALAASRQALTYPKLNNTQDEALTIEAIVLAATNADSAAVAAEAAATEAETVTETQEQAPIVADITGFLKTARDEAGKVPGEVQNARAARDEAEAAATAGNLLEANNHAQVARSAAIQANYLAGLVNSAYEEAKLLGPSDAATLAGIKRHVLAAENAAKVADNVAFAAEMIVSNAKNTKLEELLAEVEKQLGKARQAKIAVDNLLVAAEATSDLNEANKHLATAQNVSVVAARTAADAADTAAQEALTLNEQAPQAVTAKLKAQEAANVRDETIKVALLIRDRGRALSFQSADQRLLDGYLRTALTKQKEAEDARDEVIAARLEAEAAQTTLDYRKAYKAYIKAVHAYSDAAVAAGAAHAASNEADKIKSIDEQKAASVLAAAKAAGAVLHQARIDRRIAHDLYQELKAGVQKADEENVKASGWAAVARIQANKAIAAKEAAEAAQKAAAKDDVTAFEAREQAKIARDAAIVAQRAARVARVAANKAEALRDHNADKADEADDAASEAVTARKEANTAAVAAETIAAALEVPVRAANTEQLDKLLILANTEELKAENALEEIRQILYDIQTTQDTITVAEIHSKAQFAREKAGTARLISVTATRFAREAEAIRDNEIRMLVPNGEPKDDKDENVNLAEDIIDAVNGATLKANQAHMLASEIETIAIYAENAEKTFTQGVTNDKFTVFSYVEPKYTRKTGNDESFFYVWDSGQIFSDEALPNISHNDHLWKFIRKRGEHTVKVKTSKMIYLGWSNPYHPKRDSHWDTDWSSLTEQQAQDIYDARYENAFQHIGYRYNAQIFDMIGVAHAYARGITGKGVLVGVLDSHFVKKLMQGMGVTDENWNEVILPPKGDRDFHGTIVSRIIASGKTHYSGKTDEELVENMAGIWPHGVAYNAEIFPLDIRKYLTRIVTHELKTREDPVPVNEIRTNFNNEFGLFRQHLDSIDNSIDIVNISLSDADNQQDNTVEQLIEYFTHEGILVVSALGNRNRNEPRTPSTPAAGAYLPKFYGRVLAVGAADIKEVFAWDDDRSVERVHLTRSADFSRWCGEAKDFCLFAPVVVNSERLVNIAQVERSRWSGPDAGTPSYYVTPRSSYGLLSKSGFVWHPHSDGENGIEKQQNSDGEYYYTHEGDSGGKLNTHNPAFDTSMAVPIVSGAAALLKERWPSLKAEDIAQVLLQTADDIGAPGVDEVFGHGLLNIRQALSSIGVQKVPAVGGVSARSASAVPITPKLSFIVPPSLGDALHNQPLSITVLDDFNRDFSYSLYKGFLGFAQVKSLQFFVPAGKQVATRHTLFGGRLNLHLQYWQTPGLDVPLPDELQQIMEQKSSEEAKRSLGLSFSWRASGTLYRFGLGTKAKGKPYIAGETVLGLYHSMPQETQITPNYSLSVQRSVKNVGNVTLGLTMANRQYVEHFDQSYSPGGYRLYVAYSHYPIQLETGYIQDFRSVAGITGRELLDVGHGKTLYLNLQTSLHFRSVTFLGSYYVSRAVSAEADSGWFKKLEVLSRSFGLEGQWRVSEEGDRVTFGFSRPLRSTLDMGVWDMGIDEEGHYLWDLKPRNTAPSGFERLFFLSYEKSGTIQSLKLLGGLRLERGHRKEVLPERFFSFSFSYRF